MEKRFRKFLKKHKIENLNKRKIGKDLGYKKDDPNTWIIGRIYFDDQPEGWEFWYNIAKEWRKEVNNGKAF
jgi:hypothetical protein